MGTGGFWQNRGVSNPLVPSYPPRGWYPDPAHPRQERYWDGTRWTQVVRRAEVVELRRPVPERLENPAAAPPATAAPAPSAKVRDPALDLPLSGWWRRFWSGVVDTIIAWALTVAMVWIATPNFLSRWWSLYMEYVGQVQTTLMPAVPSTAFQTATSYLILAMGGVMAVYCIVFLGTWGATLGHRLAGIKVVKAPLPAALIPSQMDYHFTEEKPGWLRSISKGLGWALFSTGGSWFILIQLANVLLPLWHKRKQSLTDLFASTLVVRNIDTKKDTA